MLRLVEEEKCVVEGAGATGVAAALAGLLPELEGKRFGIITNLIIFPTYCFAPSFRGPYTLDLAFNQL